MKLDVHRYLPFVVSIAVGSIVSLVVFFIFLAQSSARIRHDFESMAADRAQAIRTALAEDQLRLELLTDYVSASSHLARGEAEPFFQEFARLARRILAHTEDNRVVAFIPQLEASERPGFETIMRRSVEGDYAIVDAASDGTRHRSDSRARYLPVAVIEPEMYSGSILGLDLSSVPRLNDAMVHAVSSGRATTSAPVELPTSSSTPHSVWIFQAVRRAARASDVASSQTGLLGICATVLTVDQLVERGLRPLRPAGIDLEIRDASSKLEDSPLYWYHSQEPASARPMTVRTGMKWVTTIDVGERTWVLTAYPTSDFMIRHESPEAWLILGGGLLFTGLSGLIVWGRLRRTGQVEAQVRDRTQELAHQISKHETLERALAESQAALTAQVAQLNGKNHQIQLQNEAGEALLTCATVAEACAVMSAYAPRLLPGTSGDLFINDPLKGVFCPTVEWGDQHTATAPFKTEDCWALRRGKPHIVSETGVNLPCPHVSVDRAGSSLCIPLAAGGRTLGLMYVTGFVEPLQAFADSVAERVSLALSNITLRNDLRQLSIHDPLTGLFNRRYMEETLETEIRRAERKPRPIGVIMIDIDHFKTFNDGFGHAAGDQMLRAIGGLVRSQLRAGDIACRYGGEEFVLILPEASLDATVHRAEDLRARVRRLDVKHHDTPLGQVTISLGVAAFPEHGTTSDEMLASADASLYKAKQDGRDRVVVYDPEVFRPKE